MKTMYSPKKEDGRIARFPFRTMRGLIMFVCVCTLQFNTIDDHDCHCQCPYRPAYFLRQKAHSLLVSKLFSIKMTRIQHLNQIIRLLSKY